MNHLIRLLLCFVPRETQAVEPTPPAPEPPKPLGGSDPEGRPDWCQEKFWNPDIKAPRVEQIAKSFNELEGKLRTKADDFKAQIAAEMKASAPESYELKQPDIELPEGMELGLNKDDPLINWFFDFAKEHGMSQETVDTAITTYIKNELATMPVLADEIAKLGDYGQDRILKVNNWLETRLDAEEISALSPVLGTSEAIKAMEKLMKASGPGTFEASPAAAAMTFSELQDMQKDPRYWREKDAAFIAKVSAGFQRLYNKK